MKKLEIVVFDEKKNKPAFFVYFDKFREEKLAYLEYVDSGFVVQCHEHVKNQTLAFVKKKLFRNIWQLGVKCQNKFCYKKNAKY